MVAARALALRGREVIVLEAASAIGTGTSSRNSEVIHAGIHYPQDSLKARLCVAGKALLYDYLLERCLPHSRCGKLIVATSLAQGSRANTPLATPLAIPQGLWFLGLVAMCVVLALMLLRSSVALVTGDIATVKAIGGVRSAQEEAEEEAAAGERMVKGDAA